MIVKKNDVELLNEIEDALSSYVIEFEADTQKHYVFVDFQGRKFFKGMSYEEGNPREDNKVLLWLIKKVREQIISYLKKDQNLDKWMTPTKL
ncbi:hypothetical protein [endosymbiont GvMRE of Glomus versiforme]|uniref:hypothetical protein n=1 Tax=endosymbiont GvMRE of Glomus versiforme TaxID=2039283 RepID=UPI000EEA2CBF|nr:hypothetical protein [endosymbiont GvMRE of Glomus versiforme]RHZ36763.1 hypothetical protein GvMRE_I2g79 [endosymbiont GvMRE of Glomus versiforme]